MKTFRSYHPLTGAVYFLYFVVFAVIYRHPIAVASALLCAFLLAAVNAGKRAVSFNLRFILPVFLLTAILNPMINHEGATILYYLKNGNPITLESVIYGLYAGAMISSVMNIFLSINEIMTDDKISYLLGNAAPYLALVFSLTLRFVPQFTGYIREAANAQKMIENGSKKDFVSRIKILSAAVSSAVTRSIEHSAQTALSMKSRGFATGKRTYFSLYRFTSGDIFALIFISVCILYISAMSAWGALSFNYFPTASKLEFDFKTASSLAVSFALFIFPCFVDVKEEIKWKLSH